jgi:hypothetical protein
VRIFGRDHVVPVQDELGEVRIPPGGKAHLGHLAPRADEDAPLAVGEQCVVPQRERRRPDAHRPTLAVPLPPVLIEGPYLGAGIAVSGRAERSWARRVRAFSPMSFATAVPNSPAVSGRPLRKLRSQNPPD